MWKFCIFLWVLTPRNTFVLLKCILGLSVHSQAGRLPCHTKYPCIWLVPYVVVAFEPMWKTRVKKENGQTTTYEWLPS